MTDKLTFNEEKHEYRHEGLRVSSVTQILKGAGLIDFSKVPPAILERACKFGTAVHSATELHDKGVLNEVKLDSALRPYLDAKIKFMKDTGAEILLNEEPLYSKKFHFAGTPDRVLLIRDRVTGIDYKSGETFNQSTEIQLAGYKILYNEGKKVVDKMKDRKAVHLLGDGTYKIVPCEDKSDESVFMACLTINAWRMKHYGK